MRGRTIAISDIHGRADLLRDVFAFLGVDPNAPNVVYANAHVEHFVVSEDSGQTWSPLFLNEDPVNTYFDSNGAPAFVGDRGIQRGAAPRGSNPTAVSKQGNLGNFLFYNVTLDPRDPHRGYLLPAFSAQRGLYKYAGTHAILPWNP